MLSPTGSQKVILAGAVGFALGIFAFPYLFPLQSLNESLADLNTGERLASGRFIHANPSDPLHYGGPRVSVYAQLLHMKADVEVGSGPKYPLYLAQAGVTVYRPVAQTMFVDPGRLKAFGGPGITRSRRLWI